MQPLVSIAMCTYNGERFLKEQLNSLINQTYKNLEIIICDDGSTDKTIDIIKEYQNNDSRIKLYQNETNLGFIKNFEKAISLTKGEYIALSDQDDIWKLHKIESFVANIGANTLIYSDALLIDASSNELNKDLIRGTNNLCKGGCNRALLLNNFISGNTMMFHKKLLKHILPIPKTISYHDIWIGFVASTLGEITYTQEAMIYYRRYEEQVTHANKVKHTNFLKKQKFKENELIHLYNIRANDLECFFNLPILQNQDTKKIIKDLIWHFRNHQKLYFNTSLYKILHTYKNDIFASIKTKKRNKLIRKYAIGLKLRKMAFFKL